MSSLETGSPLDKARPDEVGVTSFDQRVAASLEKPIVQIMLLNAFKEYMVQHLALNQPPVPIGQVIGFSQFTANSSIVAASVNTTSTSYVDLTGGPELSGLADGNYVLFYGATASNNVSQAETYLAPSVNGAAADDADAARYTPPFNGTPGSVMLATTEALSSGSNTVKLQYRVASNTGTWVNRFLIALRYSNL